MLAAYVIGGVIGLGLLVWGIIALYLHCKENYSYNIFNWINMALMFIAGAIWLVIVIGGYMYEIEACREPLNHIICGVTTIAVVGYSFYRNIKHTSFLCALGAQALQMFSVIIALFLLASMFIKKNDEA